jgi:hypothetical protein
MIEQHPQMMIDVLGIVKEMERRNRIGQPLVLFSLHEPTVSCSWIARI